MKFITDPYVELPVTFKTVSEFRRARSTQTAVEDSSAQAPALQSPEIQQAADSSNSVPLHYFDADCSLTIPTSFVANNKASDCASSALSQFMNQAVDIESAFEYADTVSGASKAESFLPQSIDEHRQTGSKLLPEPPATSPSRELQELSIPAEIAMADCLKLEQASVLRDPQESSGTTTTLEKDAYGRVTRSFFCGGECVCFQYDENGELAEFNYAAMQWTRSGTGWCAQDRQTEYSLEGKISVLENGSIRIEREDVVRILKMSGTRIDEHKSGSRTESRKLKNKPSAYDLLAKAKAANSLWLHARSPNKNSGEQALPAPLKLDLVNEFSQQPSATEPNKPMIPSAAKVQASIPSVVRESSLTCVPTAPIELRSLERTEKLRSLEDSLLEPERQKLAQVSLKMQLQECFLKSRLWLTDRMVGQSSPKHLAQLDRLAQMYLEQQKNDLAELTHLRALHIREQFFGKGQPELAVSVRGLASIYEARGNFLRAEEMYKEAIELQENGLRKILFLYSEKVTDSTKLGLQLYQLFSSVSDLSCLYATQGRQQLCAVVYEKALALAAEIIEREPAAEQALTESVEKHLKAMKQLSLS